MWILITSAVHMPRAVGAFRRAGWNIIPYPVDYTTEGSGRTTWWKGLGGGLKRFGGGLKEWIGLAAYRVLDRTDALLPAPAGPKGR